MKKRYMALVSGMMLCASTMASADVGVGIKGSTLGAGVELGMSFTDSLGGRIALNKYSASADQTIDDIKYTADLDLSSSALFLDWYPLGGSFHLTAGYLMSNNELNATATPTGTVYIGDTAYSGATVGTLDATVKMGSGPYVGLGWGNVPATGVGFTFELGVVQMGKPSVDLTATGAVASTDISKEESQMRDDLKNYDIYPVVSMGLSIGF